MVRQVYRCPELYTYEAYVCSRHRLLDDSGSDLPLAMLTRNSLPYCRFYQESSPLFASDDIPDVGVTDTEHRSQGPVGHAIAGQLAYRDHITDGQLRVPVELAAVLPPVARLLLEGRPATVALLVVAVVVDAVQREPGRAFSHVVEEVLETVPALADGDTPTAVAWPVAARWTAAPLQHARPRVVSSRATARSVSMMPSHPSMKASAEGQIVDEVGAGDEIRTRDIQLGRLAL